MTTMNPALKMRRHLKAAFLDVTFSVRTSRSCGEVWLTISWIDGPTELQVRAGTDGLWPQTLYNRHFSPAFWERIAESLPENRRWEGFIYERAMQTAAENGGANGPTP